MAYIYMCVAVAGYFTPVALFQYAGFSEDVYIENGAIEIVWTLAEDIIADSHCNGMVETDKGISSNVNTVANSFKEYKEYDWITGAARRYIII